MTTTAVSSVVLHGHFYQPPREDPWLEEVEREASAAPSHDWNERIEQECYRAVVAARRYGADGRIAAIVNTLTALSFDFGPTLLEWLERHAPRTYAAILTADEDSVARHGGHGNAMAMPYHHIILPLASRRDKQTEVRWGIADFRRRFGREPEGLWLPETAVDAETLDVLAEEGIRFTILAPHQVAGIPPDGRPGRYRTTSGREIALCIYDGPISQGVAFGGLLNDARGWAERLLAPDQSGKRRPVVAVATDGETYGHHHRFGEVALAWLLHALESRPDVRVENFASFLATHPAEHDVQLVAPSSWSCPHGVERWRSDCACRMAPAASDRPMHWRAPLRAALEWLAGELHAIYAREGETVLVDPWKVRDGYGERRWDLAAAARFIRDHLRARDDAPALVRVRELLELEWDALAMFTSCGWFFDDIAGIEAQQVLRYAARAIDLAGREGPRFQAGLLDRLSKAESARPGAGTGRDLYLEHVKPRIPAAARVAAGSVAARQLVPTLDTSSGAVLHVRDESGQVTVTDGRTGSDTRYRVSYHRPGRARVTLDVRAVENAGQVSQLAVEDLPERYRFPVVAALRADVLGVRLTPDERAQIAAGSSEAPAVAARALVRVVESLDSDHSAEAIAAVIDLADVLELYGRHVPFDAQTAFARIRAVGSPHAVAALTPVATRLGFASEG
ncbi:MAG TPA: DUF3536 domain-containing protein [Gemmatimonadales bacterium]|nr:DUF3536 domain-containing protein [Gemmatimonadales bacterium]